MALVPKLQFDVTLPHIAPKTRRLQVAAELMRSGVVTINEVRALLGLPPVAHGNELAKEN